MADQLSAEQSTKPSEAAIQVLDVGTLFELPHSPRMHIALGHIAVQFHAPGSQMYADVDQDEGSIWLGIMRPLPYSAQPTVTGSIPREAVMEALLVQYDGDFGIKLLRWLGGDASANPWEMLTSTGDH